MHALILLLEELRSHIAQLTLEPYQIEEFDKTFDDISNEVEEVRNNLTWDEERIAELETETENLTESLEEALRDVSYQDRRADDAEEEALEFKEERDEALQDLETTQEKLEVLERKLKLADTWDKDTYSIEAMRDFILEDIKAGLEAETNDTASEIEYSDVDLVNPFS